MNTQDRPQPSVPELATRSTVGLAAISPASVTVSSTAPNFLQSTRRAITHYWWQILLLWGTLSAGLVYLIYVGVSPRYEAVSMLRVEPTHRDLFGSSNAAAESFDPYLETQVQLITSPNVLIAATSDPKI